MIGNNSLILNTATMIEALQEWLDKRMGEYAPQVMDVAPKDASRGVFEITLNDREAGK